MKLFLDENIPRSAVKELKSIGFEVEHASDIGLAGAVDKDIAKYAKKQNAILITKDIEFGSLILYSKETHYGLVILRLPHYFKADDIIRILKDFLRSIEPSLLIGKIAILELGKYRIRDIQNI